MSYIPAKKMPHITARSGEFDPETGKIVHLHPETETPIADKLPKIEGLPFNWIAGAAGAGLAAIALGAFLTLRSSSAKKTNRRRARTTAKRTGTPRRRTTGTKRKTAA